VREHLLQLGMCELSHARRGLQDQRIRPRHNPFPPDTISTPAADRPRPIL